MLLAISNRTKKVREDLQVLKKVMKCVSFMTERPEQFLSLFQDTCDTLEDGIENFNQCMKPIRAFNGIVGKGQAYDLLKKGTPLKVVIERMEEADLEDFDEDSIPEAVKGESRHVFSINQHEKISTQGFHMNMTHDNAILSAAFIAAMNLKDVNIHHVRLFEVMCVDKAQKAPCQMILCEQVLSLIDSSQSLDDAIDVTVNLMKALGDGHLSKNEADKAILKYQTALNVSNKDPMRFDAKICELIPKIKNNMGLALKQTNQTEAALTSFTESLVAQMLLKDNTVETAYTINNLASCFFDLNKFDQALNLFERALTIYKDLPESKDSMGTNLISKIHNNIGLCYMEKENFEEALKHFHKFLEIKQSVQAQVLARVINNIACCYSKLGKLPKALSCFQQAYKMQVDELGEDHVSEEIAMYLHNIGNCFLRRGSSSDALEHFQSALAMRKKVFGDQENVSVANTLFSIGMVYEEIGQRRKSVVNLEESLKMAQLANPEHSIANVIQQAMNEKRRFSIF